MSLALRAREEAALARIAKALDFKLDSTRLRADELEDMATSLEGLVGAIAQAPPPKSMHEVAQRLGVNAVADDEIDEDPAPGIEHGHPFHLQLPNGVVLRGRVDVACEAELAGHGSTVSEVMGEIQTSLELTGGEPEATEPAKA